MAHRRRAKTYRKLLKLTGRTVAYVEAALPAVAAAEAPWSRGWVETATAYLDLLGRVTEQTPHFCQRGWSQILCTWCPGSSLSCRVM